MKIRLLERFILVFLFLLAFNANASGICASLGSVNGCNDIPIVSSPAQGVVGLEPITKNTVFTNPVIHGMSSASFSEGVYHYQYRFNPASNELVNQFVVPYFSDAQISNIQIPTDWISSIVNPSSFVSEMKWTYVGSTPLTVESPWIGFLFDSPFAPSQARLKEIAIDGSVVDYEYGIQIPLSPLAIQAGFIPLPSLVSEPETSLMLVAGLGLVGFAARRKQK